MHIIMQCILSMILLQERVFPVALTEGATLLPSLLLLLIFVLLSCVLLTILIIRGRWKLFGKNICYFLPEHIHPTGFITPMKKLQNFDCTLCHSRSRRRKRDKQLSNGEQINFQFWKTGLNSKFGSELKDAIWIWLQEKVHEVRWWRSSFTSSRRSTSPTMSIRWI